MRKVVMLFVMILTVIAGNAQKKDKKIIYPEVYFDSLQAKTMLGLGTATIEGRAFTKPRTNMGFKAPLGEKIYASNATVVLLPVTPYFEAWHDLRKKKGGKKTVVYMSDEAYRWRLETKTDGEGHFTFKKMKPGKYFLQVFVDYDMNYTRSVYTGSGYSDYGRTDYYTPQHYSVAHSERAEEYVEVKEGDDIVKVKLK
jgi:hypothetical protein